MLPSFGADAQRLSCNSSQARRTAIATNVDIDGCMEFLDDVLDREGIQCDDV